MKTFPRLFLVVLLSYLAYGSFAEGANVQRTSGSNAVASCQSALPAFDVNIRKRPMALSNEGSTTAFITCGTEHHNANGTLGMAVYFVNRAGAANVVVRCSLVSGLFEAIDVLPKTSEPMAVGSQTFLEWNPSDNDGFPFVNSALSCALPPGVDIAASAVTFSEDVGN